MRILIAGASRFSRSGYGMVVRNITPVLVGMGHEVAEFGVNGQAGTPLLVDGVTLFPRGMEGMDALGYYVEQWRPDWVLAVGDPWTTSGKEWEDIRRLGTRLAMWFPVQAAPMHPYFAEVIGVADVAISFTRWGAKVAEQAGVGCTWVPLGVDAFVFRPGDRSAARAWLDESLGQSPAGRYVIGMVAANVQTLPYDRKGFGTALMALRFVREVAPKLRPLLYVHTLRGSRAGGMDLPWMAHQAGVYEDVAWAPDNLFYNGLSDEQMVQLYRSFDVLLAPSRTEGFGLPLVEAQACGTPVVGTQAAGTGEVLVLGTLTEPVFMEPCDGVAGGMTPVVNVGATASALIKWSRRVVTDGERENAWRSMRRRFHWGRVGRRLMEALDG